MSPTHYSPPVPPRMLGWLTEAVQSGASDLHVIAGHPPVLRLHGDLIEVPDPTLDAEDTQALLQVLCPPESTQRLAAHKSLDFSFDAEVAGARRRFRANLFLAGRALAGCFRVVPSSIPSFEWAGFPEPLARRLAFLNDGLVIFTGVTGSGKTTSLAMIVNLLNQAGGYRIITVEDPLEYVFPRAPHSVVTQREVGPDVLTFADGLKFGLRQDPDVILVGEIRDQETAQMALSAAETGHLVFTTMHTRDTKGAITRYADLFSQEVQRDVRAQLAMSLRAIISQRLLPAPVKGAKRLLALEVLWNTHPIASAIRLGKFESIDTYLTTGRADGMVSFDESIRQLHHAGEITRETAEHNMKEPGLLDR